MFEKSLFSRMGALLLATAAVLFAGVLLVSPAWADDETADKVTWTTDDFTYGSFSDHFYGCDYSRQFDVKGTVVTGFSDAGQSKFDAGNTAVTIPAKGPDGKLIVGVGDNAFEKKGLTAVTFPTGMMCAYTDTLTKRITKRGNFVIGNSAFAGNKLKSVYLPQGVLVVKPNAFMENQLTEVTLPRTIWWVETQSFAHNQIAKVNFPQTTDFQLELHGMPFADNNIKSVRLPDFTEVVNKYAFAFNPGMTDLPSEAPERFKTYTYKGKTKKCGLVYMYADTADFETKDRIHHIDRTTANTKSWVQKLVVNKGTPETQNPDTSRWTAADFTITEKKGSNGVPAGTITGLSKSGIAKRKTNKHLVLPSYTSDGYRITAIAATKNTYGLFATAGEGFETVELPDYLENIGDRAFAGNGLTEIIWSPRITSIGMAAFQRNSLTSVVLPDTVKTLGGGAFGSNPTLARVDLSSALTEIPDGAFGCSDAKNWMIDFTDVTLPSGITRIGQNAFAGNNFAHIDVPASVKEIGKFAFSTKNYLKTECTLTLHEGLETIGDYAFRNKIIQSVNLPTTVKALPVHTFQKAYSASVESTVPLMTKVFISSDDQWKDQDNFPRDCYGVTVSGKEVDSHRLYQTSDEQWTAADFTYGDVDTGDWNLQVAGDSSDKLATTVHVVTGLSDQGKERLATNRNLVIPATDGNGAAVCGVAPDAFEKLGLTSVTFPEGVRAANEMIAWNTNLEQRGNFFIGAHAFQDNEISQVTLPEGALAVLDGAFSGNAIKQVSLPSTLFYLGSQSFANNRVAKVETPAQTDYPLQVGAQAFASNQMTALQLPANTGRVDGDAFAQNPGIDERAGATADDRQYGVVYLFAENTSDLGADIATVTNGKSAVQDVKEGALPSDDAYTAADFTYDGTAITGWSATGKVKRMTNHALALPVTNPAGQPITAIGNDAFRSPDREVDYDSAKYDYNNKYGFALTSVTLPKTLTSIGDNAFLYNDFGNIDLPAGLKRIGATAFKGNHILRLTIPDSATTLGDGCFSANSLIQLKLPAGIKTIPAGAFSMNIRMERVELPQGLKEIGDTAFAGARLTSLKIPSSVTKIGRKAFHLHRMERLTVPGTVKEIGDNAFEGTFKAQTLKKLTLGEGIEHIGSGAFKEGLLQSVNLPRSLKTMGAEPFENNTGKNGSHVVRLITTNSAHLAFNKDAKWHKVVLSLSGAKVSVKDGTYNGKAQKTAVKVTFKGKTLKSGTDYTVSYANNKNAGKARATVSGKGNYTGSLSKNFTIAKAKQPLKAQAKEKTVTLKAKKLKKRAQGVSNLKVSKAQGKITYKNLSKAKAKKFKISPKGKVTVPEKTKKGTYTVKVQVTAKGTKNYQAGSKTVAFKVKVE